MNDFLIIAGSLHQAREYCRKNNIPINQNIILHSPRYLRGIERGRTIKLIGTYYMREDWDEFLTMIKATEAILIRD